MPGTAKLVSIDSMILIWMTRKSHYKKGGRPVSTETEELQKRAGYLLFDLNENGYEIVIPDIVLAEFLYGIDAKNHAQVVAEIQKNFFVHSFDTRAAMLSAKLWQEYTSKSKVPEGKRVAIKSDVMIIATARVHGASAFYSHDVLAQNVAKIAGMTARDLPERSGYMFADEAISETEPKNPKAQ
jgi:predicted nucleic acid-binding protein